MTLDEAIKHAEEVAEEKEKDARFYTFSRPDNYRKESSENCAAKHRQLAEWLKELKQLKEQEPKTGHWIYDPETDLAKCDRCGAYCHSDKYGRIETPYCAMCGVKMVESQESEE